MDHLRRVRTSVSIIFFINGIVVATWASRIPAFQARLQLSPGILGKSLMVAAIGSVLAMPTAGWFINVFGSTRVIAVTSIGSCLALPLLARADNVVALSLGLLFYGAMTASMDVAMNTHGVLVEHQWRGHIMSSFHALFSLGGFAGAAIGALAASHGITPATHFRIIAVLLAVVSIAASMALRLPEPVSDGHSKPSGNIKLSSALSALAFLAFSIFLFEGAMADWSALYLRSSVATGPGLAALGYAAFSAAMVLGRLLGDHLTTKLGRAHLLRYGTLLAAIGLAAALIAGTALPTLIGFICVGAGLATIIPNTFASAGSLPTSAPGPSLAFVTAAGYLGFLVGPPLIGFAAQLSNLRTSLWILVALSAFGSVTTRFMPTK